MIFALVLLLAMSSTAQTATLTITPDKQVYQVGETITLSIVGDPEGTADNAIFGRIRFDGDLADYVSSHQEPLTSFSLPWVLGPLTGGEDFGDALNQFRALEGIPPDGPLIANVTLLATAPGALDYSWQLFPGPFGLDFFGLTDAPGGSVTIVPEPATGALVALGLIAMGVSRKGRVGPRVERER